MLRLYRAETQLLAVRAGLVHDCGRKTFALDSFIELRQAVTASGSSRQDRRFDRMSVPARSQNPFSDEPGILQGRDVRPYMETTGPQML